ncbi:MAG: two-component system nitrate/nitrite sensor histidine kinase NarX [Planctomycetota bacterium]|jgi:two-component system nitrate/nitrite sensor histidine kinase NarX
MSADAELNVVRIVQECLANVRKHSQAKSVRISLTIREQQNSLLCEDDGIGFDESKLVSAHGRHLGLNILRNRAKQLNGSIEIESEPGEGTRIQVQFQLPNSYE